MIEKFLLKIFLLIAILASSVDSLDAQERQNPSNNSKSVEEISIIQRGARSPEIITDLESSYCSGDSQADIYVDQTVTPIPGYVESVVWYVYVVDGSDEIPQPGWIESIGTAPNNGVRFFPDRVPPEHYNQPIVFRYTYRVGFSEEGGSFDWTYVRKDPEIFTFGPANVEICKDETTQLTLANSEIGFNYYLYRAESGGFVSPIPSSGNGAPLVYTVSQSGTYSVWAESNSFSCEKWMNGESVVVVNNPPDPDATSNNLSFCEGDQIELYAEPDGMSTYTWEYPDGTISNLQDPVIPSAVRLNHNGVYSLTVVDGKGCVNSTTLLIAVNENPSVTLPTDFEVCEASALTITASVTGGTGPYTFAWEKDGSPLVETSGTLSIAAADLLDAGLYEVTVTDNNSCGSSTASVTVGVTPRPVIDIIANDGPVCDGGIVNLSASASSGTGTLSYSWSGPNGYTATVQNPTIDPANLAMDGIFTLVVTDASSCNSLSSTTDVVINPLPTATLTGDTEICEGLTGSYTAGGGVSYTFTVLDASNNTVGTAGPSATSTYTTPALPAGTYSVVVQVEDANGCTDEETLGFTVYPEPVATIGFDQAVVCEGESTNLEIELTTGATLWSVTFNDGSGDIVRSGLTGTIHTEAVTHASNVTYTLVSITDGNGCTASPGLTTDLLVNEVPVADVTSDNSPADQVCVGGTLTLTASATGGSGNYVYQWYRAGTAITGATAFTYQITNAQLTDAGEYSVVVGDVANGITCSSSPALLTVDVTEATATLTGDTEICEGSTGSYTAGGGVSYTFTVLDASNNTVGTAGPSATSTYTTPALPAGTYSVVVQVEDANSCTDEETLALAVYPEPVATIGFDQAVVCEGESTNLEIELTTGATPWSVTFNNGSGDFDRNGIIGTTHTEPVTHGSNVTYTLVSITDANGCAASPGLTTDLLVNEVPVADVISDNSPADQVCVGGTLTLTATAAGGSGNYVYQWYRAGTAITGATAFTYQITNAQLTDAGEYSVVVGDVANGITCSSSPALLTVNVTEATATLTGDTEICEGSTGSYTAGGGVSYTFTVLDASNNTVGTAGPSATSTYTTPALPAGTYSVVVQVEDANSCTDEETLALTVYPEPVATIGFDQAVVCEGESTNLEIELTTGATPWSVTFNNGSGDLDRNGIIGTIHTEPVTHASNVTYTLVSITDANGCTASPGLTTDLLVNEVPVADVISDNSPADQVCVGGTLTLTASATGGSGNYVYQWYRAGTAITGATAFTYQITNAQLTDAGEYSVVVGDVANGITCSSSPALLTVNVTEATATLTGDTEIL
jgi:hypothetical protein